MIETFYIVVNRHSLSKSATNMQYFSKFFNRLENAKRFATIENKTENTWGVVAIYGLIDLIDDDYILNALLTLSKKDLL